MNFFFRGVQGIDAFTPKHLLLGFDPVNVRPMPDSKLPSILVVDDNQDNAHIIRDYLEARGYPISVAYDGDEAMRAFERDKPSLILLDVMMPGRDGWQVCREMKEHPTQGSAIRVIMVTALQDWMNKRQALETGADDFVEKPFELAALVKVVERNAARLTPTS
jgi:two-component system response regulator VicR